MGHAAEDAPRARVAYAQSFEGGDGIPYAGDDPAYFAWHAFGNGRWEAAGRRSGRDDYHDGTRAASAGGRGRFATEAGLALTVGGGGGGGGGGWDDESVRSAASLQGMQELGGFVTFDVWAAAELPLDKLLFELDGEVRGEWTTPTAGWETVAAWLPPVGDSNDGGRHEFRWTYRYFGTDEGPDDNNARQDVVQLDALAIEAITGDLEIADDMLRDALAEGAGASPVPELDLAAAGSDGAWSIRPDSHALSGAHVFAADTRGLVRDAPANANGLVTYRARATMTFAVVTGPRGGTLRFATRARVRAPIDVLEVGLDGVAVLAATSPSDRWEKHSLELKPGRHVLTFTHVSNPADLPMRTLEATGRPGSSQVDGLRYEDHGWFVPSAAPTPAPSEAPTPHTVPPQNYCGTSLAEVRGSCHLGEDGPLTCNDDDGPCPIGTFCWGSITCLEMPAGDKTTMEEFLETLVPEHEEEAPDIAWVEDTPDAEWAEDLPPGAAAVSSSQNYCAGSRAAAKDTCASGTLTTCNEGDPGLCPTGTACWRDIECNVAGSAPAPPSPLQNYCGTSRASVEAACASGAMPTCNDGDGPCPVGTFCWGGIECADAEEEAPAAPALPSWLSPQNYCGTSLASVKASCASGALPTCNDGDEPCADGTFCWGGIECDGIQTETPTASPVEEEKNSILGSFFSSNSNSNVAHHAEGQGADEEDSAEEVEPPPWDQAADGGESNTAADTEYPEEGHDCPEGTSPPPGMPACCVPDPTFLGDGACDAYAPYNTEACGYDLGDCCRESCRTDTTFACAAKEGDAYGPFGFYCLDPLYGGDAIDEEACGAENREWVGDGGCDPDYNTAECGWDGGDCCRETCDEEFAYYECGRESQPFDCKNPDIIYRAGYVP